VTLPPAAIVTDDGENEAPGVDTVALFGADGGGAPGAVTVT